MARLGVSADAVQKEQKRWTIRPVFRVPFPDEIPLSWRASLVAAYLVQIVLAVKSVWLFREQINPDAVSYIRIAKYYLSGQTDLMVSGVWSPLLSWLIVPWLLDELAREYRDTHDPEIPEEIYRLARQLKELDH